MNARLDLSRFCGRRRRATERTRAGRRGARRPASRLLILAAVLVVSLPVAASQAATARATTPLPYLLGLHMVNRDTGWAVSSTELLRTTDGGHTWRDLTPAGTAGAPIEDEATTDWAYGGLPANLAVLGRTTAWLAVPATGALTVYSTTDRGAQWQGASLALPNAGGNEPFVLGIDFVGPKHGFLALSLGGGAAGSMDIEIYASSDGGATWQMESGGGTFRDGHGATPLAGIKTGFGFADRLHGWLTGASYANGVWLYASKTGGKSWHSAGLNAPRGSSVARMLHRYPTTLPPWFVTQRKGFLPVFGDTGTSTITVFFATPNGGTTWRKTTPVTTSTGPSFWGWQDARHGFVSDTARLEFTSNAGLTWHAKRLPAKLKGVAQIDFGSRSVGWAIVHGKLLRTINKGHGWTSLAAVVSP